MSHAIVECPECGKVMQSLGYANHRAMHYRKRRREQQGGGYPGKPVGPGFRNARAGRKMASAYRAQFRGVA